MKRTVLVLVPSLALVTALLVTTQTTASAGGALVLGKVSSVGPTTVTVYRWPAASFFKHIKIGERVPWTQVAKTTTSNGSFALALSNDAVGNLEVVATNAKGVGTWFFSRRANQQSVNIDITRLIDATHRAVPQVCPGPVEIQDWGPQWTTVGQSYVVTDAVHQGFTYVSGQSSTLGVAIAATEYDTTWTASGSTTNSLTETQQYAEQLGDQNVWYQTEFDVQEFMLCDGLDGYAIQPVYWWGGAAMAYPTSSPATKDCAAEADGTIIRIYNQTAVNWSAGVSVSTPFFSASLSAQTGYSTSAEVNYEVLANNREECGSNGDPPASAPIVVMEEG